jgi:hypothetical protein
MYIDLLAVQLSWTDNALQRERDASWTICQLFCLQASTLAIQEPDIQR